MILSHHFQDSNSIQYNYTSKRSNADKNENDIETKLLLHRWSELEYKWQGYTVLSTNVESPIQSVVLEKLFHSENCFRVVTFLQPMFDLLPCTSFTTKTF